MLNWANQFNICCFLDNNNYSSGHHSIECLLGAGCLARLEAQAGTAFRQLAIFADQHNDWIFGHLGYNLKNETENLDGKKPDQIGFADLHFFVPAFVIELQASCIRIGTTDDSADIVLKQIISQPANTVTGNTNNAVGNVDLPLRVNVQQRYSRDEYLETIRELQQHILRGDCYEINFCQEFFAEHVNIDPLATFLKLSSASPNPFAAFYRVDDCFLLCASPERYLQKKGRKVLSQPIKGTLKRETVPDAGMVTAFNAGSQPGLHPGSEQAAGGGAAALYASAKDRSENVMVVDLVRNDLSRLCTEGSVVVEELFGVYTFPQVYQMISTISGELRSETDWLEIIRVTFPMGSMTGAPKRSVLKLIDQYERTGRGLFSGAVGYISPDRDFDFNVVIRSILYNRQTNYLSFPAGSGITFYSDPESEYEECLIKAAAIRGIIEQA